VPDLTLIETGGTICMEPGPEGLRPSADRLREVIRSGWPDRRVLAVALTPLVDSAEVGPALWNDLLDRIDAAPGPVLITHGTDTMAFTGAALDAALAGQGRVVVLCGSMHPLGAGEDAEGNLALAMAATEEAAPGVWLAFAGQVVPAGALTKVSSTARTAFARAGDDSPAPQPPARRYDPALGLAVLTLTPGMSPRALESGLSGLDGAILRVFGAGTVPSQLVGPIADARANGCAMIAVSQCLHGGLTPGAYAAGAGLWAAGVENGGAMSPEQALTRLWLRLSDPNPWL
jgi:L-asparaginase